LPRSGRRAGAAGTREAIVAAARSCFRESGYGGCTIRGIAAVAGVDPALVLHYFGSKEGVFRHVTALPFDPAVELPRLLAPGVDGLGSRLVTFFLETWESPGGEALAAIMSSVAGNPEAARLLREFISREVLGRIAAALPFDRPQLRATLAASQLLGLAFARYVVRVEPLASISIADAADLAGPTLQRYLAEPLPGT
jgi:AcrR family transcriptional regulator